MLRLVAVVLALGAAFPALAQDAQPPAVGAGFTPQKPGKGTSIGLVVDGTRLDRSKDFKGFRFTGPTGLKIATSAVAIRCTEAQAKESVCPEASRIGAARVNADVTFGGQTKGSSVDFVLYLGAPRAPADLASVILIEKGSRGGEGDPGYAHLTGGQRPELAIEDLGVSLPPNPDFRIRLRRFELTAGASRRITITKTRRVRGKKKKISYRKTRHLLTTPRKCPEGGSYLAGATINYSDGTEQVYDVPMGCRR